LVRGDAEWGRWELLECGGEAAADQTPEAWGTEDWGGGMVKWGNGRMGRGKVEWGSGNGGMLGVGKGVSSRSDTQGYSTLLKQLPFLRLGGWEISNSWNYSPANPSLPPPHTHLCTSIPSKNAPSRIRFKSQPIRIGQASVLHSLQPTQSLQLPFCVSSPHQYPLLCLH
jgi:hypothetical protein